MTSSVGTILWMAPEVAAGERYTEACDVFSYAIILWQLLTRRTPYHLAVLSEVAPLRLLMMISEEARRPTRIHSCPLVLERLLEAGWARQAEERPEMGFVARLWRFIADICAMPERPNKLDWQGGGKRRVQESESESVEACIDLKALKRCDSLVDALSSSSGRRGDFLRDFSEKRQVALVRRRGVDDGELKRMRLRIEAEVEEKDVERLALKLADAGGEWCCVVVGQGGVMAQAVSGQEDYVEDYVRRYVGCKLSLVCVTTLLSNVFVWWQLEPNGIRLLLLSSREVHVGNWMNELPQNCTKSEL